jgi:hypothetical protein
MKPEKKTAPTHRIEPSPWTDPYQMPEKHWVLYTEVAEPDDSEGPTHEALDSIYNTYNAFAFAEKMRG